MQPPTAALVTPYQEVVNPVNSNDFVKNNFNPCPSPCSHLRSITEESIGGDGEECEILLLLKILSLTDNDASEVKTKSF